MPKETKEIQVNIINDEQKEIVVRQGIAVDPLPLHPRVNLTINSTDIFGPSKFWAAKKTLYEALHAVVNFDSKKGIVKLHLFPDVKEKYDQVTGTLSDNPELHDMEINSEKKYSHSSLMKKLKWARAMFPDRKEFESIISNLQNFKAKVDVEIEKTNDQKGNTLNHIATKVQQNIPLTFNLKTNLFIGQPEMQFDVIIIVDVQGQDIVFSLESMTLYEQQNTTRAEIVQNVISEIDGVVAIETKM